jgi:hypothetical protein
MITIISWFRKNRHHKSANRRSVSSSKNRRLTLESIENRLLLAVDLTAGAPPVYECRSNELTSYIDISGILNIEAKISALSVGNQSGMVCNNGTADFNWSGNSSVLGNSSQNRLQIIHFEDRVSYSPPGGMIDIGPIATVENPHDQPIVSSDSKKSLVSGTEKAARETSKIAIPMSVDGIRGRSQFLEVAQSAHRESNANSALAIGNIAERHPLETIVWNAKPSSASLEKDLSAIPANASQKTGNNREISLDHSKIVQIAWEYDAIAANGGEKTSLADSPELQVVVVRDLSNIGEKAASQTLADSLDFKAQALSKADSKGAISPTASVSQELHGQPLKKDLFAEENFAESKPLPIASEENHRFRLLSFSFAAIVGHFALPGWRNFFFKSKTHYLPPRRRESAK